LVATVQRELRAIDPAVAVEHVKTLEQFRDESYASQTFAMRLLAGFALVGCALALVGIYGVLSLSVASRRLEIAVRMAVGAQRRNILGLVLSEGLKLIAIGLVIGTGIAIALGRLLQAFLFGVQPADPVTFTFVVILFTAVALLACFIPARRATRINPMTALRDE
jgi:putative ABC transport system permease protein